MLSTLAMVAGVSCVAGWCSVLGWCPFYSLSVATLLCSTSHHSLCVQPALWSLLQWIGYTTLALEPVVWLAGDAQLRSVASRMLLPTACHCAGQRLCQNLFTLFIHVTLLALSACSICNGRAYAIVCLSHRSTAAAAAGGFAAERRRLQQISTDSCRRRAAGAGAQQQMWIALCSDDRGSRLDTNVSVLFNVSMNVTQNSI